ncbi:MAG TPA: methyltransferase domain-containing protein [Steroidobacteraceae bacterium]|nr:methyltransferase domain-containing protein [Steroidobacteraceae bacterium]
MSQFFSDANAIADYAERTARLVPGLSDMQRMAALLIAEGAAQDARVLVVGAGGGLELKLFAERHPAWRFAGVDPSAEMLELAKKTLGPSASRVDWHLGYVGTAPAGPFDAASCLLTLHFVAEQERARTLDEIHERLKPGAPFVAAHLSFDQSERARGQWLDRYVAYAVASGVDEQKARTAADTIGAQVPVLSPEKDVDLMRRAGFRDVELFYVGLAFRGWVARA